MDQNTFNVTLLEDAMPRYKLSYFNVRARAETSRMIFAVAGVEYEDHRFQDGEWPNLKEDTPFGHAPLLQIDNKVLCQSHAIEHYLARQFGLAGKTHYDQARADMIIQCIEDTVKPVAEMFTEKDEDKKEELRKKYNEEQRPKFLKYFDQLQKYGKPGHFIGKDITYADIAFYNFVVNQVPFGASEIDMTDWPDLKEVYDSVAENPRIKEWIEKRPETAL